MTGSEYYDLDGQLIDFERYVEITSLMHDARRENPESSPDDDPTRIGSDHVGEAWVSTVWLGLNHAYGNGPPLIFETLVFGGETDGDGDRYSTRDEARAGHERIVDALKAKVESQ